MIGTVSIPLKDLWKLQRDAQSQGKHKDKDKDKEAETGGIKGGTGSGAAGIAGAESGDESGNDSDMLTSQHPARRKSSFHKVSAVSAQTALNTKEFATGKRR